MTPWIKSYQSLGAHRKLKRASRALDTSVVTMVGHLHFLWWWALDNIPPDGSLRHIDEWDIAEGAHWDGDPQVFVAAITKAGFIDRRPRALHNYREYGGALAEKKEKNRQRMREAREQKNAIPTPSVQRTNEHVQRTNEHVRDLCKARGEESRGEESRGDKIRGEDIKGVNTTKQHDVIDKVMLTSDDLEEYFVTKKQERKEDRKDKNEDRKGRLTPKRHPNNLAPLFDAFRARSMPDPVVTRGTEQKAAKELMQGFGADKVAECWEAVLSGTWGDAWMVTNLSFQALSSHNRLGNYVAQNGKVVALRPRESSKVKFLKADTRKIKQRQEESQDA